MDRSRRPAHRFPVTAATQDRLLAVLLVALAATGLVSLRMGASNEAWLFAFHGLLAAALAVTALAKIGRSLPKAVAARRWRRVVLGSALSIATVASVIAGFAWVASGRLLTIGAWTVLTLHAWIGIVLIPIAVLHLAPRRWRLLVPRPGPASPRSRGPMITRRRLLAAGVLGAASLTLFGIAEAADRLTGGVRRFTGSRWLPAGGVPPSTTFLGEGAPDLDPVAWRLRVHGQGADTRLSLAELTSLGVVDRTAVLDCTSGWALETTWRGIPHATVLAAAGAKPPAAGGRVIVRASTGWSAALDPQDLEHALLAFGVAGGPLPVANGAPCRLILPDHRGLDWVKWVVEVEVESA
jgi:DMSO/TMAO reductase YedYZ molybdopterin-dependent catalytic subunit